MRIREGDTDGVKRGTIDEEGLTPVVGLTEGERDSVRASGDEEADGLSGMDEVMESVTEGLEEALADAAGAGELEEEVVGRVEELEEGIAAREGEEL